MRLELRDDAIDKIQSGGMVIVKSGIFENQVREMRVYRGRELNFGN